MVKINKIYTRTGDDGTTGLIGGARVSKCSVKVSAYGDIDELNSWMGLIRTVLDNSRCSVAINQLTTIQNVLFDLGAVLASPSDVTWPTKRTIEAADIAQIESWIDDLTSQVAELRSFVLPGGTISNSYLHIARTVCRRAERSIIGLAAEEPIPNGLLTYINRLSDYLFALARFEITSAGHPEFLWNPGTNVPVAIEPQSGE